MCGIVGFAGFEDKRLLERMKTAVSHRGPDDHGSFTDKNVSLGHRRLSIIDLSRRGRQPMHNEDRTIWVTFNGEIYNFFGVRAELEKRGHKFLSDTDTEIIVHGYEEWGEDCVKRFGGIFAFALWDSKNKKLFMARDRIGVKPLYYTQADGKFLFASEIKAILEAPFVERKVNIRAFYDYLTYINTPSPQTLFEGIYKLEPGHTLVWEKGNLRKKKYWDILDFKLDYSITEKEAVSKTGELLRDSIRQRMISDVPQGVFLSGGLDSSTITSLMSERSDQPVNTFSIATGTEEKYNELRYAKLIADRFNTNHHEIVIGEREVIKFLPKLIHHEDEPIGDPVNVPVYYLAKAAKDKGVTVLQVGEGADELFCGYPAYRLELMAHRFFRPIRKMPGPVSRLAMKSARGALKMKGRKFSGLMEDQFNRIREGEDFPWHGLLAFTETEKPRVISDLVKSRTKNQSSYDMFRKICSQVSGKDSSDLFLQKERVTEFRNRLSELLLMRVDKFTMATAVEARVPFLDHTLVEFLMRIPPYSMHMKKKRQKYILKKAVKGMIPQSIINRKKIGFGVPISRHLEGLLKETASEELMRPELKGYFNTSYAEKLLSMHASGSDQSFKIWILLNFALWHKYWIEGEKIRI